MPRKSAQIDNILAYLKKGYRLTPLRALQHFGTMRLAAYIHELRKLGWNIISKTIVVGPEKKRVSEYKLVK